MEIIKGILQMPKKMDEWSINKLEFIETHVDQNMGYAFYHNYSTISAARENIKREIHWIEKRGGC